MRIGINCRTILAPGYGEHAGVGYYTDRLVRHVLERDQNNEYVLFFDSRVIETSDFEKPNVTIRFFPFAQHRRLLPFTYTHLLVAALLAKERLDVYHAPAGNIPLTYPGRSVVTVHDLAIYHHPEWFRQQIFSTKILFPKTVNRADRIIAVSESTKRDIEDMFHIPSRKIRVIYEGADREEVGAAAKNVFAKYKMKKPYLLFVGTLEPRKNVAGLVRAYGRLIRSTPRFRSTHLVLAGAKGWKYQEVFDAIREGKLEDVVHPLGYVRHAEKVTLAKEATAFVFPTLYEGFGLPVLEAMTAGVPVISSNISSIPEITREAAILVDPSSEESLASAMHAILADEKLRKDLSARAMARAKKFSWDRCAQETIQVYHELGHRT